MASTLNSFFHSPSTAWRGLLANLWEFPHPGEESSLPQVFVGQ
jgi:hypothetical protein